MFEFLANIDNRLFERYLTLERNVKAASNSFYDSYLAMLEQFVKTVLETEGIENNKHDTCGAALRRNEVKDLFINTFGVEEYTFNKMQDYTLKVNAHKHNKEKKIAVDTIVSYLRVFYDATTAYCLYKSFPTSEFDGEEIYAIFGVYETENENLKTEIDKLRSELATYVQQGKLEDEDIQTLRLIGERSNLEKLSLEEQNRELQKQFSTLKDIKLAAIEEKLDNIDEKLDEITAAIKTINANNSSAKNPTPLSSQVAQTNNKLYFQNFLKSAKKYYHYCGGVYYFKKEKNTAYLRFGAVLCVGLLATVLTSIACKIYSTFTLIENIWMIFIIAMIAHVTHAQPHYEHFDYSCHSAEKFELNANNLYYPYKWKISYKLFRILTYISAICNIIYMCTQYNGAVTVFAIIVEIGFAVATFLTVIIYSDFFCGYSVVYYTNTVSGKPVTIVHDITFNKLYSKEEYEKLYKIKDE